MIRMLNLFLLLVLSAGCTKEPAVPAVEIVPPAEPKEYNLTGLVEDVQHHPLSDVVVTDGMQCVITDASGHFFMNSDMEKVRFVSVSTPSGYLPPVTSGSPRFYKTREEISSNGGVFDCGSFVLSPVPNPDNCTIIFMADPQPRATGARMDNVAYHSLDNCQDLYRELKEVGDAITDRQVYAVCLGDIVHENMGLYSNYVSGIATLGFPVYNVIGNHDNNPEAQDDASGAADFESHFGPANYSFNIAGMHIVVLDDLIMYRNETKLSSYNWGLTDEIWAWLQEDMKYIPRSSTVMTCAHSPMFKCENGSERTNTSIHGGHTNDNEGGAYGYGDLFDEFREVHAWAGHTHSSFNYVYSSSHRHKNVQVHTVARSTGELWTNEYLANGTPRGFTIVEVRNGQVDSWRFHPVKYQSSVFAGKFGQPSYSFRDWDYVNGVAHMKDTGAVLDESYQMHVYAPGTYSATEIYANVFLWDGAWQNPVFTPEGGSPVSMTRVTDASRHDWGTTAFKDFYYKNYSKLVNAGYSAITTESPQTLFKASASEHGRGTVSVTDRFGNSYTRTISW